MIKFRILFLFAKTALLISAKDNDKVAEENKNINLYLVPPPGLKSFLPDSETQYQQPIPTYPVSGYEVKQQDPDDQKIAIRVLQEDQKTYVVKPTYNNNNNGYIGYNQAPPKLQITNPENPNTKYALEPEGPNKTKVTVKIIKEHKKTYAVDPAFIENKPDAPLYNTPQIVVQKVEPDYTRYEIKAKEPQEKNVFIKVAGDAEKKIVIADPKYTSDNTYEPKYRQIETVYRTPEPEYKIPEIIYKKIREEEPEEKKVYVRVAKEDRTPIAVEPKYTNDNTYLEPSYREYVTEYRKSNPDYEIEAEGPQEKNVFIKVLGDSEKKIVIADPKFTSDNTYEPKYRTPEPEYKIPEIIYKKIREEKPEEKKVYVRVAKEDRTPIAVEPKYTNDNTYLEPAYRKSVIEYRKFEPDNIKHEIEKKEPKLFVKVVNDVKKTFEVDPKYKDDNMEPVYKKSVTEFRKAKPEYGQSEIDYKKYEDSDEDIREKKVFIKVIKEDKTFEVDPKYPTDKSYLEPVLKKSVTQYRKSDPEYRQMEKEIKKYEDTGEADNEKEVFVRVVKEDKKTFDFSPKYKNDNAYFEPENGKSITEYEKSEPQHRLSESDYDKYEMKEKGPKEKKVFVKVVKKDKKTFIKDSKNKNDNTDFEPDYRKSVSKHEQSEPESEYVRSESDYDKYDDTNTREEPKEQELFNRDSKYENENTYLDDEYRQSVPEYKESEVENNKRESDYDKYDDNQDRIEDKKVFVKVIKEEEKAINDDSQHKIEKEYFGSEYRKYDYKETESKSNSGGKYDEPDHDVLVKIWTKKS